MQSLLLKVQTELAGYRRSAPEIWSATRRPLFLAVLLLALSQLGNGAVLAASTWSASSTAAESTALQNEIERVRAEAAHLRAELARHEQIYQYSARFDIPANVAALIKEAALAENVDPEIAFNLVRVESRFNPRAVSSRGAIGYTQILPSTARELDPEVRRSDLFDGEVNLRLGFRFFRTMLDRYDGNTRLALLAYNRGPGTVNRLLAQGRDPGNGYSRAVLGN